MSQYKVTSLNYFFSGEKEKIINLDLELPESVYDNGLKDEDVLKRIAICLEGTVAIVRLSTKFTRQRDKYNGNRILKNVTFIANVQEDDNTLKPYVNTNQFSMMDTTNGELIHPLYDINDMCLKSNIKKVCEGHQEKNNTDKFVDIYSPQMSKQPIHSAKLDEYAYIISDKTKSAPIYLRTDLDEQRKSVQPQNVNDSRFHFQLKSGDLNTYLYGSTRYEELSSNFKNRQNLSSIEYNYVFEVPLNATDYNDFPNGDMQAEIFQTKNSYNSLYSMEMSSQGSIENTRQYCGIGVCSDRLYMKYFDNLNYEAISSAQDTENGIENVVVQQRPQKYSYQKIETIDSINRFKSNTKHKSNLYSVSLRNTGLNTNYSDSNVNEKIEKLKNDIKNNIREITKQICPVNTQLFDVYFDGV